MQNLSRSARAQGLITLIVLACLAVGQVFVYQPALDGAVEARPAPPVTHQVARDAAVPQHPIASIPLTAAPPGHAAVDAFFAVDASSAAPGAPASRMETVPQLALPRPIAAPPMPFSHVGFLEEGGVRMAVLASGDLVLLKRLGEDVGTDFRLAVVDPPALLHVPTGTLLPVPLQVIAAAASSPASRLAPLLASEAIVAGTAPTPAPVETIDAAEIEAAIARALAAPGPEPIVQSSFPLAR